ncbi:hypothetical protein ACTGJ9_017280 [Bradyrhizobium sp. RDM12]
MLVKAGDVLFQIDPTPFQSTVMQLQASLAAARQKIRSLESNYEQATANIAGLAAQLTYNTKRLADTQTLSTEGQTPRSWSRTSRSSLKR